MNIRHRITLLVVLTFVSISSIGGYAIVESRHNASQVKSVTEGVVPSALASADLVSQLKDVQLATIALVSAPDATVAGQLKSALNDREAALKESLEQQTQHAITDAQRGLLAQSKESLHNYLSSIEDTAKLKLAGQTELAEANLYASVAEYQREIGQIIETLRVEKRRSKDEAIAQLNERLASTSAAILGVTVITVLVLTLIGVLLYRQITRPISRMQEMMSEIASSQDFTRRVPVGKEDEIGRSIIAFNTMIAKIQESSAQLKQKTNDIQTMLHNIPQGILTIGDGNRVHPEYSTYLETIFETRDISGRDMMELVFADTNLGSDALAQIEAVGGACINEDVMNFQFNEHLMIGEVEKRMPDGRIKVLDLSWSPITDEAGTILRLMLCVRDVTELRKLAAEANEKKRELEIIGEILAVSQEKFHEFIASSIKFIDDNEIVIRRHTDDNPAAIAQLFRNMHTIKGNARTYGLQHLTNTVHEAEQTYDKLRQPRPEIAWDQGTLLEELAGVREAVENYAKINEISLGRKGPGRRGSVERFLMVEKAQIDDTVHRLETVNTGNLHELVAAHETVRKTLRLLGTEPLEQTLASIIHSLPALARQLGKEAPIIQIEDNGYVVRSQVVALLKNVFMHLIRNSMDHGLERAEERLFTGKPGKGRIRLSMSVVGDMLQISLADDGRGLALDRIRTLAVEREVIADTAALTDEEVAQLIFRPGFSTATQVSEVSGRGVGMDAVQDFIKREKGRISIRFTDDAVGAAYRQFETLIFLPESSSEHLGTHEPRAAQVIDSESEYTSATEYYAKEENRHVGSNGLRVV